RPPALTAMHSVRYFADRIPAPVSSTLRFSSGISRHRILTEGSRIALREMARFPAFNWGQRTSEASRSSSGGLAIGAGSGGGEAFRKTRALRAIACFSIKNQLSAASGKVANAERGKNTTGLKLASPQMTRIC